MTLVGRHQPRLRAGRGRPRGREPDGFRDLLRGEAAVLHRGQPGLPALRPQRRERLHQLLLPGAAASSTRGASGARRRGRRRAPFVDAPASTTILGAAKLVGRSHGWNLGVLEALTGREYARIADGTTRRELEVEPLTNYFVLRGQRDLGARAALGFLGTATNRDLRAANLEAQLPQQAYVGGFDGHAFLDGRRDWVLSGGLSGSTLSGSEASVLRLQRASQRYYQRPDAPHVAVDPAATSLSGWSGRLGLNKNSGNVTFNAGALGHQPGLRAERPRLRDADRSRAARTGRCCSASSRPTASRAGARSRSPSGGRSTTGASRRATACSSRRARSCGTTGSSTWRSASPGTRGTTS